MSNVAKYTETGASDHAIAKRHIARVLSHVHDRGEAVSSRELEDYLNHKMGPDRAPADTTIRDLIPEIRRERAMPIANAPGGGYYVVSSTDDLEDHLERIDDEIDTRLERKRELTAAFNSERVVGHE